MADENAEDHYQQLDKKIDILAESVQNWRHADSNEKRDLKRRIGDLEIRAISALSEEETILLKEAAGFYRARRKLRERLYGAFIEKGMLGLAALLAISVFYYAKSIITGDQP